MPRYSEDPRRPVRYGFGQALGDAIQGAGKYYGDVAIQKKNAEALALARAEKVADRDLLLGQRTKERTEDRANVVADQTTARELQLTDLEAARELQIADREAARLALETKEEGDGAVTETLYLDGEGAAVNPGTKGAVPTIVRLNKDGARIGVVGPDPDYGINAEGSWVKLSAGGKGTSAKQRTEAQTKMKLHSTSMEETYKGLEKSLADGYDLSSATAFTDRAASNIGFGNYLMTEEGQVFNVNAERFAESLFKGESGAAGSDAEAARYRSFIPLAGDKPETIRVKLSIMKVSLNAFSEAAGEGATRNTAVDIARSAALTAARANGLKEVGAFKPNEAVLGDSKRVEGHNWEFGAESPPPMSTEEEDELINRYRPAKLDFNKGGSY